jgi:predicted DNA-binding transcriptional regulator YafY
VLEEVSTKELSEVLPKSGLFGVIEDSEEFEVTLKFSGDYAKTYVADRIWSKDQSISFNKDGSLLLKFKSKSRFEVISFINSFGSQVEVIAPEDIR